MTVATREKIFAGTLEFDPDGVFLQEEPNGSFVRVDASNTVEPTTDQLHHKKVSIFGHMGELEVSEGIKVRALIAKTVIRHDAIALRAFEISRTDPDGSALENWLRAERELHAIEASMQ